MEQELIDAYNKGFESGKQHASSSPQTMELMQELTKNLNEIKIGISDLRTTTKFTCDDIKEIKEHVKETNGAVAANRTWINRMAGGMAVIIVLVIPLIVYIYRQTIEHL